MAVERAFLLMATVRPADFEVLEDGKNVFASPVSSLESNPSSPEPVSLPTKDFSTNSNGPKPAEAMPDDDRENFFAGTGLFFFFIVAARLFSS
uniref:Sorting nexin N-terminal domain-containing protein n=1 Tax=Malurus cyaneus samueli TaxID=2593467 RepID=A0A8C5TFT9_9PASS